MTDGTLVWWILVPLFAAVGIYLIWYSRSRKKKLENFARRQGLQIRPEQADELQQTLNRCFSLRNGVIRSFGQIRSIVDGGSTWIFRTVELLDLNPHAQSYSTHFTRIAVLFGIPENHDAYFLLDRDRQARQVLSGSSPPDSGIVELAKQAAAACNGRHPISMTLSGGYGLIYFEPLVTGGETASDIDALYCMAKHLREELATDA